VCALLHPSRRSEKKRKEKKRKEKKRKEKKRKEKTRKDKKRLEKTTPFGVSLMRSQVLYRAAQTPDAHMILKHLHNVETHFHCPQTFLSLDFQCRDDVSELEFE